MNWNWLNSFATSLNSYANLLLVIITAIYVWFTYKMSRTMSKQVISDIKVDNALLGSDLHKDYIIKQAEEQLKLPQGGIYLDFKLTFDIRNRSSANGSIDKPDLIIKFKDGSYQFVCHPITKDHEYRQEGSSITNVSTTDLGGTIFLQGGKSEKIELVFKKSSNDKVLMSHLSDNSSSVEYYLSYKDNLGKSYLLKIDQVKDKREVGRH